MGESDTEENKYLGYYQDPLFDESSIQYASMQYNFDQDPDPANPNPNKFFDIFYSTSPDWPEYPAGRPLVVLLHANNGTRTSAVQLRRLAKSFVARGYVAVVPDYTTGRDEVWGLTGLECLTEDQFNFGVQRSVRDVRAVIRRALKLSVMSSEGSAELPGIPSISIDPNTIFLTGISYGATASMHTAYYDVDDFPAAGTTVEDFVGPAGETSFAFDLDDISVCPDGSNGCLGFLGDFDVRDGIKGIAVVTPMILDLGVIRGNNYKPILSFHGTCDAIVPFDNPTAKEAAFRRYRELDLNFSGNIGPFPCENADYLNDYKFYGTREIYKRLIQLDNIPSLDFDPYYGIFAICGKAHNVGAQYLNQTVDQELWLGIADYEIPRFFANIINQDNMVGFSYTLDHSLHPNAGFGDEAEANQCPVLPERLNPDYDPRAGDFEKYLKPLEKFACPSCDSPYPFVGFVPREPVFSLGDVDDLRYQPIPVEMCQENEDQLVRLETPEGGDGLLFVQVYTYLGEFAKEIEVVQPQSVVTPQLLEKAKLLPGTYLFLFPDGDRQVVVVE